MDFCSYSMDFWLIVVQALSLRCFTLTVRPRVVFVSPAPRALPRLLFRRLSRHGSSCRHLFLSGNKITHQREYPEPDREFANMRWTTGQRAMLASILINVSRPKPKRLIFATPGNGGTRDFFEGFTEQFVLSGVHCQIAEGYHSDKMLFAIQYR